MRHTFFILLFLHFTFFSQATDIHFSGDPDVLRSPVFGWASRDVKDLLAPYNGPGIHVELVKAGHFVHNGNIDSIAKYAEFKWNFSGEKATLTASSYKGFANGLYALLQEKLGFKFYHCREMIKPDSIQIPALGSLEGRPVFDKMGFHIHSMHPLELTESLLDENFPNALQNVKEYIDWLARNGQNYFEFNLLESINRDTWIKHAQDITAYAHLRGIFCGVDLSIHMIQQKAFQLYAGMANKKEKIQKNAEWLLQGGFDIWNVELSTTEFSQGDQTEKKEQLELLSGILKKNGVRLFSRAHVVKADKMVSGDNVVSNENILSPEHGLMVHTVMFYSLNDSSAPVYENKNLWHMRDMLLAEKHKRETWYYPESAYWITFDNSVPMFLMPYLSARLEDINYCEKENIPGHLTFSSGWEWGYWLIDWSIARWSWNYYDAGKLKEKYDLQYVDDISSNQTFKDFVKKSAELQQKYIKDEELIRVLVAHTITDEIPGKFNLELHPRPKYMYKYIRNEASLEELEYVQKNYTYKLNSFFGKSFDLFLQIISPTFYPSTFNSIEKEIYNSIQITSWRAWHKSYTLSYLVAIRKKELSKKETTQQSIPAETIKINLDIPATSVAIDSFLVYAEKTRLLALEIVRDQEIHYRYPLELLSGKYESHTAYHHGYLFTVHNLHFWEREELQAKKNKYKFWFRSIWNIPRIIGVVD